MLTRFISGVIYLAIIILCLLISKESFNYLLLAFAGFCLYEYGDLVNLNFNLKAGLIVMSLAVLLTNSSLSYITFDSLEYFIKIPYLILLGTVIFITINQNNLVSKVGSIIFGVFYITIPFYLSLEFLNEAKIFIWFFAFLIVNDTFAYVTGSKFGRNKLAPTISPGKTVEGFVGGLSASIILGFILESYYPQFGFNWIIISIIASIFGTIGDLVESKLKREAKVKDSSGLIPGHGGFLDRLDSFIFAIPFIYIYIKA